MRSCTRFNVNLNHYCDTSLSIPIVFMLTPIYLPFIMHWTDQTRGPLALYRSPECWGYAELEQTWKYKSTQCCTSCQPYRRVYSHCVYAHPYLLTFHNALNRSNQRTIGPVSLTWVLRICWIRTNLEIQEHSMLYKLSTIQKGLETNLTLS